MSVRDNDPGFADMENGDELGEQAFAEGGFEDAPNGGPLFSAPEMEDSSFDRTPGRNPQKVAGVPKEQQNVMNSPSEQRPDSEDVVIRERGGESKGDPAVGGTRPD